MYLKKICHFPIKFAWVFLMSFFLYFLFLFFFFFFLLLCWEEWEKNNEQFNYFSQNMIAVLPLDENLLLDLHVSKVDRCWYKIIIGWAE